MATDRFHLAVFNFGIHVAPFGDPAVEGFARREPLNFEAAARSSGFVGRSGYEGEPGPESWGERVFPRFLPEPDLPAVSSLSLWSDLESLMAFSYSGVHAEALKHARRWNVKQAWPALVLFWVSAGERPDWQEAVLRFEHLADHGASPRGFTFKQAYGPDGESITIDRARVKALAAENAERQGNLLQQVLAMAP